MPLKQEVYPNYLELPIIAQRPDDGEGRRTEEFYVSNWSKLLMRVHVSFPKIKCTEASGDVLVCDGSREVWRKQVKSSPHRLIMERHRPSIS